MTTIYTGDLVRVSGRITRLATGALEDPTATTAIVRAPDRTRITGLPVTKDATGLYHFDVGCDQPGRWQAQLQGTGVVARSGIIRWAVEETL